MTAWGAGVGMHGIPGDVSSPSRFVRVAYTNAHYPQQNDEAANVSRLFHTLGSVQMVDGMAKMGDGQFERTLFTSGYSSKTNTYYMNTYDDPALRSYAMADFDMDSSELITAASMRGLFRPSVPIQTDEKSRTIAEKDHENGVVRQIHFSDTGSSIARSMPFDVGPIRHAGIWTSSTLSF